MKILSFILEFAQMDRRTENPYVGKYQFQKKATGSRVIDDIDRG